ncbi:uncharacterized protein LOC133893328 [Phragmites australis]|uniref:uncharacterized protein LOC133893328 n=1 Tax=Phragmites australis TaxID=29695 RepID=UPI002D7737E1|nr:uncharacterized protein LOC133893328 [Phragmites australis]
MPPMAAADAFLVLEFVAGNRCIPHAVFAALLASLPSLSLRTSPRLRRALVLRALHAALHVEGASSSSCTLLLGNARRILADPDASACFPQQLPSFSLPDDDARAAAVVADLKRLLDHEWANLPPSTLELAADRIAGDGALETWASASDAKRRKLRLLVGESKERQILAKLGQDTSASHPLMAPEVDNSSSANETDHAQGDDEPDPSKENTEEDRARHQEESVKGAPGVQLPEKSVASRIVSGKVHDTPPQVMDKATTSHVIGRAAPDSTKSHPVAASKRCLMERNPGASTYEWDGLGDSDDERPLEKRQLPPFERKSKHSSTLSHKTRKKWSEIQEKTLLEGVEKYGKGNWKDIKMAYPDIFEDRSTVDLKDKFRNMERHQCV